MKEDYQIRFRYTKFMIFIIINIVYKCFSFFNIINGY